jgi:hypothetical protein
VIEDAEAERVAGLFLDLPALVNADADLVRRGRFLTCDFELGLAPPFLPCASRMAVSPVSRAARFC